MKTLLEDSPNLPNEWAKVEDLSFEALIVKKEPSDFEKGIIAIMPATASSLMAWPSWFEHKKLERGSQVDSLESLMVRIREFLQTLPIERLSKKELTPEKLDMVLQEIQKPDWSSLSTWQQHEAMLPHEYARFIKLDDEVELMIKILRLIVPPHIDTTFGSPLNTMSSLLGKEVVVRSEYKRTFRGKLDKIIATGVLEVEGNTIIVSKYRETLDSTDRVWGMPFLSASFNSKKFRRKLDMVLEGGDE